MQLLGSAKGAVFELRTHKCRENFVGEQSWEFVLLLGSKNGYIITKNISHMPQWVSLFSTANIIFFFFFFGWCMPTCSQYLL